MDFFELITPSRPDLISSWPGSNRVMLKVTVYTDGQIEGKYSVNGKEVRDFVAQGPSPTLALEVYGFR